MKWRSIQALRGIAVLGVVAFHALSVERKYSGGDPFLPDILNFGQTGVDLFFVISGFIMVTVTQGRFGSAKELYRFLWSRVTRIYPTYWFYFFITAAIFLVKPAWVNASQGNNAQLVTSFILWPTQQLPLVMVGWSLIHELWFYLVFAVLLLFSQRWLLPVLLFWAALVITGNFIFDLHSLSPAILIILHSYTLEFIIGALLAWAFHRNLFAGASTDIVWIGVICILLCGFLAAYSADVVVFQEGVLRAGLLGLFYGLLVLGLALLEQRRVLLVPRFLQFIGDISYTVYLSHVLVLSAIGRLWVLTGPRVETQMDNLVVLMLMLIAVIGYGWVGYRLIELPAVDMSHRLRARWRKQGKIWR